MRLGDLDALLDKFLRSYTEQEKVGNFQFVACEIKQALLDGNTIAVNADW